MVLFIELVNVELVNVLSGSAGVLLVEVEEFAVRAVLLVVGTA
jgi:hypothetical protein